MLPIFINILSTATVDEVNKLMSYRPTVYLNAANNDYAMDIKSAVTDFLYQLS